MQLTYFFSRLSSGESYRLSSNLAAIRRFPLGCELRTCFLQVRWYRPPFLLPEKYLESCERMLSSYTFQWSDVHLSTRALLSIVAPWCFACSPVVSKSTVKVCWPIGRSPDYDNFVGPAKFCRWGMKMRRNYGKTISFSTRVAWRNWANIVARDDLTTVNDSSSQRGRSSRISSRIFFPNTIIVRSWTKIRATKITMRI